jgi:UDP-N-acetylmuramate dehydrogenase
MSYTTNDPDFPPCFTVEKNVPLARYSNIRIGGPAQYLAVISDQTLFIELYRFCREISLPFLAIGQGTNILFSDKGRAGMTAVINFDKLVTVAKNAVVAEAGATLEQVMDVCIENGLNGFEFASGIPGTIGGAVFGNAGAYGNSIGELITRARILTPEGKIQHVGRDFFKFAYRHSFLKEYPAMLLQVELQLEKGDTETIAARCREIMDKRRAKLPPDDTATAGSWFKNIKDEEGRATAAAVYLEAVGAKETSIGDAAVHPKHANIFYNKGRATAAEMLKLQEILQARVFEQFGVRLQREVIYIE